MIAGVTNRKFREIKDKSEETEDVSENELTSEVNMNTLNLEDYKNESVYIHSFYT